MPDSIASSRPYGVTPTDTPFASQKAIASLSGRISTRAFSRTNGRRLGDDWWNLHATRSRAPDDRRDLRAQEEGRTMTRDDFFKHVDSEQGVTLPSNRDPMFLRNPVERK